MIRETVLLAVLAIPILTWGQMSAPPSTEVLTLEQAVALAIRNNRQVKSAALEVEKSQERVGRRALNAFPPSILPFWSRSRSRISILKSKRASLERSPRLVPFPPDQRISALLSVPPP